MTTRTTKKTNSTTKTTTTKKSTSKSQVKKKVSPKKIKDAVIDALTKEKLYKEAEKLYKNKEYDLAYDKYLELLEKYKDNKKLYKRLLECLTKDYTFKDKAKGFNKLFNNYEAAYKVLATKKELTELEKKLEEYKKIKIAKNKSKFILITFLGYFGIHKFIEKKFVMGIIYLLTFGIFGIGVIVDLINDYAEHEDELQLNIIRYLIALLIITFGIIRQDNANFYYFIIIGILFTPLVYDKVLKLIPGIIKILAMIVLVYLGFRTVPVINYVPTSALGTWETKNENTNLKEINIKLEETIIKFNDRKDEKGINVYDNKNHILTIEVDDDSYYKFTLNLNDGEICVYTESRKCVVKFEKKK